MPMEIYEVVAQGARYWFLFLMVLIVWRSYRWYARDRKQRKKRLRLLPDAGYIGEMVVVKGNDALKKGLALPVPREGTLGFNRMNDLCVPVEGVARRHCLFLFTPEEGLSIRPCYGRTVKVDDEERTGGRVPLPLCHGSRLYVGEAELRLRLFAGFEIRAHARNTESGDETPEPQAAPSPQNPVMTPEQFALWQQQQYMQQMAYMQWMAHQQAGKTPPDPSAHAPEPEDGDMLDSEDGEAFDYAPQASQIDFAPQGTFYPPADSDEGGGVDWPYAAYPPEDADLAGDGYTPPEYADDASLDEDMTDASVPRKSAYIGHDEAEEAKKRFWDRYLGGGEKP